MTWISMRRAEQALHADTTAIGRNQLTAAHAIVQARRELHFRCLDFFRCATVPATIWPSKLVDAIQRRIT